MLDGRIRGGSSSWRLWLSSLLLAGVAIRPPTAAAGGVGKWTNLSGATGSNLTQVGLVRTPDGLLRVAWIRDAATPGLQDLMYRTVKASGAFCAAQVVQAGWSVLNDPALLYDSSLRSSASCSADPPRRPLGL